MYAEQVGLSCPIVDILISTSQCFSLEQQYSSSACLWRFYLKAYTMFSGLLLVWMFYSEGDTTLIEASRTAIRQGTLKIVNEEVLWSIRWSYQTIRSSSLTNAKWQSVAWPSTITTLYWSDFIPIRALFTELDLYRLMGGFHRTFVTGVTCWQGTSGLVPFWTCICSTCWDQSFSRTWFNSSDTPRLAPFMNVLFWGRCDFPISLVGRDMSRNVWNRL